MNEELDFWSLNPSQEFVSVIPLKEKGELTMDIEKPKWYSKE